MLIKMNNIYQILLKEEIHIYQASILGSDLWKETRKIVEIKMNLILLKKMNIKIKTMVMPAKNEK